MNIFHYNQFGFSYNVSNKISGNSFYIHNHNQYEILFVCKGVGTLTVENRSFSLVSNTLFLIPPTLYHLVKISPSCDYERFVVNFSPALLPRCIEKPEVMQVRADDELRDIFSRFKSYCERYKKDYLYPLSTAFITELLLALSSKKQCSSSGTTLPSIINQAIDYISDNLTLPLSNQSIADALFISRSRLVHVFKETMKIPLMRYIRLKKLYASCDLLQAGVPAVKVCEMMGFSDYSTFYRDFKRELRKAPSAFYSPKGV